MKQEHKEEKGMHTTCFMCCTLLDKETERERERKKEEKKWKQSLIVPVFTATILAYVASFGQCRYGMTSFDKQN